ncbi:MAG TPA: ATP-binding protein [Anaerolineaceae bacterium]|nr:ATP-binding protein [Anaerolineaceae bacterium]
MAVPSEVEQKGEWETLQDDLRAEAEQSERALKEINLMLEQSQAELNKLAQRNTAITVHLQQVQSQIDTLPRADIRMAYDAALDAQHRLFVMRGQLEKLQSDQAHLQRYISLLDRAQQLSSSAGGSKPAAQVRSGSASETVEMLINAQEAERQRLSRQMHDGPAQALSNFILQTEIAVRLFDIDQARAREELTNLKLAAMATFQKVRNFIFELRPMMLDDLGLVPTIKRYGDTFKEQTGMDISVLVTGVERRMEPYLEVMVFRALQELMGNAARHSQASQVKVQMDLEDNSVHVTVDDNGKGFSQDILETNDGIGLKVIKDRVEMLGGYMDIDSTVGQGTRISFQVPSMKTAFSGE